MDANARTVAVNGVFLTQPLTGVQRYALELLSACARPPAPADRSPAGRYRIVLVSPWNEARAPPPTAPQGTDLVLDPSTLPAPLWIQVRLPILLRRLGSPLLWSPTNTGPLAVKNQVVTIFDASVFAHPEWFSRSFRFYYRLLLPRLARRVARVVTISEFSRQELARHGVVPAGRVDVVPCGVSAAFHPGADSREWLTKKPYVLAVGSRDPRKNLATLLRAWALLPRGVASDLRLLVAGGGSHVYAREAVGDVPPGVEFLGAVPDRSLPGLYAAADALVYPSLYEGFGLPPLEAMACGTPTIVSNVASLPEVCGDAALCCDPLDERTLAGRIERVLADAGLRARLRTAGLVRAARFTWEGAALAMIRVLDAVHEAKDRVRAGAPFQNRAR